MHIPDGFIDAKTATTAGVLAAAGLGLALRRVRHCLPPRRVPLLGLTAAFLFTAQMLNFPVAGGTSGHLLGGALAAVLLGPSGAVVVMSAVVILQCFLFADGGVTALGANLFNMAVVAPGVGYVVYTVVRRSAGGGPRSQLFAVAFASWCSTVAAALACTGELASSGTVAWGVAFAAMTALHMLIGLGEALLTTLVIATIVRVRPELLLEDAAADLPSDRRRLVAQGLLLALGLVVFLTPLACSWPDGLETVAAVLGFAHRAAEIPVAPSPFPEYAVPGIGSAVLSTIVAGCVGTVAAFVFAYLLARFLTPSGFARAKSA